MAATTRATSTEPFPALEAAPRTPKSFARVPEASCGNDTLSPKSNNRVLSPVTLTGVAATQELRKRKQQQQKTAEDARETSPNPAVQAMQTLMGGGGMSRPSDAPAPDKLSEPMQVAAQKMNIVDHAQHNTMRASPASLSSFTTNDSAGASAAMTATAHNADASGQHFVAEPAQMTEGASYHSSHGHLSVGHDQDRPQAFSYPGPPPQEQNQEGGPSRGMSLPGYGQGSPKSPASNKRHKCPYCSTDFTRHHNLKSHLLTHSQEKPYVCQTCQARFRRLHDLKRHTKLHTGERPHTCDKCGRKFARGDALARHNKGPGGCAGRRSSFGGDGEYDDDEGMDGVEYGEEEDSPDQGRRVSEPSRKRTHLERPEDSSRQVYRQQSSTYPPPYTLTQQRAHASSVGSMGPPQVVLPGQNANSSPRDISNQNTPTAGTSYMNPGHYSTSGQVLPQQSGMIESPKPLSPGQPMQDQHRLSVGDASMSGTRNRSPSLTTQFQQAHFGRGSGGRTPPQPPNQFPTSQHPPVLPPLTSQNQARSGLQSTSITSSHGPSMLHHQQLPPSSTQGGAAAGSNPGSLSSHGRSSGSSMRDVMGQDSNDIWAYVRNFEQRYHRMQEEYDLRISRLQEEIINLRQQVSGQASYSSEMAQPRY